MPDRKSLLLLSMLVMMIVPAVTITTGGNINEVSSISEEITLVSGEYYYAYDYLEAGEGLYYTIYPLYGDVIEFYVMDEDDFDDFSNNSDFSYQRHVSIEEYYSGDILVPYNDTWFAVLYNDPVYSQGSITVQMSISVMTNTIMITTTTTYTTSSVETYDNNDTPFILIFFGIIAVIGGFIGFAAIASSRRRHRPYMNRTERRGRYPSGYNDQYQREERVLTPRSRKQAFTPAPVEASTPVERSYTQSRAIPVIREQSSSSVAVPSKFCRKCGNTLAERDKFCTKCGWTIKPVAFVASQSVTASERTVTPQETTPAKVYGRDTDTCRKCGSLLPIDSKSCSECGANRAKCPVCKRNINFTDISGSCPDCLNEFHYSHLRESIKVTGKCPMCRIALREEEIIVKSHKAK